jgi:hypothetical protein
MSDTVRILRHTRKHWDGSTIHEYEAYCLRCHRDVWSNPGRVGVVSNASWRTKPPARKAATAHLEMHRRADERLASGLVRDGWEIVEEVTL